MKIHCFKSLLIVAAIITTTMGSNAQAPIDVRWDMGQNDAKPGYYSSKYVIKNTSDKPLEGNWMFFFNQFSRRLELDPTCPVDIEEISTTYYQVKPNERYSTLAAGDSLVIDMMMKGKFVNLWYAPAGGHLVLNGDTLFDIDLEAFCNFHTRQEASVSLALRQVDDTARYGAVQVKGEQIIAFQEKNKSKGQGVINGGVYAINK